MLLLLPAVINDPESSGFDTGAASGVEISHPDLLTTFQLLLLIVCFPAMGHASDQIKTADRRIKVIGCVSRHDIAAVWVAFFSRWQRDRC